MHSTHFGSIRTDSSPWHQFPLIDPVPMTSDFLGRFCISKNLPLSANFTIYEFEMVDEILLLTSSLKYFSIKSLNDSIDCSMTKSLSNFQLFWDNWNWRWICRQWNSMMMAFVRPEISMETSECSELILFTEMNKKYFYLHIFLSISVLVFDQSKRIFRFLGDTFWLILDYKQSKTSNKNKQNFSGSNHQYCRKGNQLWAEQNNN